MESLIALIAIVLIGGPILLLFLVIGARRRIAVLEQQVGDLKQNVNRLVTQLASRPSSSETALEPKAQPARVFEREEKRTVLVWDAPPGKAPEMPPQAAAAKSGEPEVEETAVIAPRETPPQDVVRLAPERADQASDPLRAHVAKPVIKGAERFEMPAPPAWIASAKEWLFGGNLVAKAGLLILFIGVSFLLKYAAARVTVPIELRLCGIVLADIGLLLWGWRIRESRPAISLPVQGAALGIMMLVTFGAFRLYDVIPGTLAFGLLFLLTAFTCLLAVLQDAIWLAVFGIAGGFAAPILTSTGHGSHIGLFSYYALLNAGILAIALKRSWRLLNLLGFAFTFVIATTWGVLRYVPENYLSVQGFLILFVLFYVAISILYASRQAFRLKHYVDGTLVFGTPLVAFGLQYGIVHDKPFGLAFSALVLGLFYIGLTLALWKRRGDSLRLLVESFLALGIVFGTLAIPFAVDGRWTSAAWALEGAGIVWVGLRQKQTLAWVFGVLVQVGAWISFMASLAGLEGGVAAQSNLWLGFLLLAVTGFAMAMNFRRETGRKGETEDGSGESSFATGVFPGLANLFLGVAALWLMAGLWTEIGRHDGPYLPLLLVVGAMGVAGLLGLIAVRLAWKVSRYFALVPQVVAGVVFLRLLDFDLFDVFELFVFEPAYSGNLFDTGFLGGLLIALGAGVSSLAFHRQPEDRYPAISRTLLGWCGFWWFFPVLGSFSAWANSLLSSELLLMDSGFPRIHPVYGICIALAAPLFVRLARRLAWPDLRWMAFAVWPALLYVTVCLLFQFDRFDNTLPPLLVWLTWAALGAGSEYLLRDGEKEGWLLAQDHPRILRAIHALRTVGPWLILWPLGHQLVVLALRIDSAEQAALLAEAGWFTSGSWARYLPAWAMMAFIALLIPRARLERWPTVPIAEWYRRALIPLGALWSVALAVVWNLTQNGVMQPLPYLPVLNPLDLTTGFSALLAVFAYRLYGESRGGEEGLKSDRYLSVQQNLPRIGAIVAYAWFNLMLLRTAAHFLDIPYQIDSLFRSQFVQAMLSLVWSTTALVLMRFAAGRKLRGPWMAGAGLLVLVVAKLFFVDLTNVGGVERIVSFLGVGVLMVAIGYLAPFPSEQSKNEVSPS